jgi:hypothetical protein
MYKSTAHMSEQNCPPKNPYPMQLKMEIEHVSESLSFIVQAINSVQKVPNYILRHHVSPSSYEFNSVL